MKNALNRKETQNSPLTKTTTEIPAQRRPARRDIGAPGRPPAAKRTPAPGVVTRADVQRLTVDPSAENRQDFARRIAALFAHGVMDDHSRRMALEIFALLARDIELTVRIALAESLKSCPLLPRPLARRLAYDVAAVATPIIESSEVLADDDLVEIVCSLNVPKQAAVARRQQLSPRLVETLTTFGAREAVETLIGNTGAMLTDSALHRVLDRFGENSRIQEGLIGRSALPPEVLGRLVGLLSESLRAQLAETHGLPAVILDKVVSHGEAAALGGLIGETYDDADLVPLLDQLAGEGRLTPGLILRALFQQDLNFFEAALAQLSGWPQQAVAELLRRAGESGFRHLYEETGLPRRYLAAFSIGLQAALEARRSGGRISRKQHQDLILQRLMQAYDQISPEGLSQALFQIDLNREEAGQRFRLA